MPKAKEIEDKITPFFCLYPYTPIPLCTFLPRRQRRRGDRLWRKRRRREPTFGSGEGVIAEGEGVRGDRQRRRQSYLMA